MCGPSGHLFRFETDFDSALRGATFALGLAWLGASLRAVALLDFERLADLSGFGAAAGASVASSQSARAALSTSRAVLAVSTRTWWQRSARSARLKSLRQC
jgi:hypothetical protein